MTALTVMAAAAVRGVAAIVGLVACWWMIGPPR